MGDACTWPTCDATERAFAVAATMLTPADQQRLRAVIKRAIVDGWAWRRFVMATGATPAQARAILKSGKTREAVGCGFMDLEAARQHAAARRAWLDGVKRQLGEQAQRDASLASSPDARPPEQEATSTRDGERAAAATCLAKPQRSR